MRLCECNLAFFYILNTVGLSLRVSTKKRRALTVLLREKENMNELELNVITIITLFQWVPDRSDKRSAGRFVFYTCFKVQQWNTKHIYLKLYGTAMRIIQIQVQCFIRAVFKSIVPKGWTDGRTDGVTIDLYLCYVFRAK